ncbi:Hypothetical predicted protein [Lynx pardinus]|uniref:TRAF3-interacting protein 1 N-terminal domain-containing protein n=1 Tax=Lynx pardinus TaxID=191816 RepID=A0A485N7F7_LYNPA|nr:Hypothetical predicted protein [Lynx pardinus]
MKGLYTDAEMKSDNVKDKDAKISFLQKAIDVVVMVSGEPLSVKPVRIVAGHEPERTNELLQRIGKCCLGKLSSDDAVKRVLAGERGDAKARTSLTSKSQELDNRNAREEGPGVREDKEDKRYSEINEESARRDQKQREEVKEESKARDKDKDKDKTMENDRERHKEPERDKYREGERERARNRAKQDRDRGTQERDKDVERERERRSEAGKEKERRKERERERERDKGRDRDRDRRRGKDGDHSRNPDREKSREHDKPERKSSNSGEVSKKLSDGSVKDSKAETETEVSTRASGSVTAKMSKRRSKNSMEGRKEDSISAKILGSLVSGLNNEPDQETTTSNIGTKEANTNSASVSDDHSASLRREHVEPGPAVKQKGKRDTRLLTPFLVRERGPPRCNPGGLLSPQRAAARSPWLSDPHGVQSLVLRRDWTWWVAHCRFFTSAGLGQAGHCVVTPVSFLGWRAEPRRSQERPEPSFRVTAGVPSAQPHTSHVSCSERTFKQLGTLP